MWGILKRKKLLRKEEGMEFSRVEGVFFIVKVLDKVIYMGLRVGSFCGLG